mgnify:CR=1 FL=1
MSRLRTFFLETTPEAGPASLAPPDKEHALKVLRVRPGDRLLGIDGCGKAWELEVTKAERRRLQLESIGPARVEPAPGTAASALPWIEVWAPLPKRDRAEDLLGQLTQLGVARYVPLITAHTEPQARELPESRESRMIRTAREALKQCGRLWMPEIGPVTPIKALAELPGQTLLLAPDASTRLSDYLNGLPSGFEGAAPEPGGPDQESPVESSAEPPREPVGGEQARPTPERPIRLVFGPEGGLNESEEAFLAENGAIPVRVARHILRIETAALTSLAIVAERWS